MTVVHVDMPKKLRRLIMTNDELKAKAFEICQQDLGEDQRHTCDDRCAECGYAMEVLNETIVPVMQCCGTCDFSFAVGGYQFILNCKNIRSGCYYTDVIAEEGKTCKVWRLKECLRSNDVKSVEP